jgi:hypothetical protein
MSAMVEPDAVVASARYWGAQARIGYAEAFAPCRLVLDLMPTRSGFRTAGASRNPAPVPAEPVDTDWRSAAGLSDAIR